MYNNECPITVVRYIHTSVCTISRIYFDGMMLYGLEPSNFIVPEGTYLLTISHSPRFSSKLPYKSVHDSKVPLVNGVKGHTGIRLHVGNYPSDTDGCLLLGLRHTECSVLDSVMAYKKLLNRMSCIERDNPNVFYVIKYRNSYE